MGRSPVAPPVFSATLSPTLNSTPPRSMALKNRRVVRTEVAVTNETQSIWDPIHFHPLVLTRSLHARIIDSCSLRDWGELFSFVAHPWCTNSTRCENEVLILILKKLSGALDVSLLPVIDVRAFLEHRLFAVSSGFMRADSTALQFRLAVLPRRLGVREGELGRELETGCWIFRVPRIGADISSSSSFLRTGRRDNLILLPARLVGGVEGGRAGFVEGGRTSFAAGGRPGLAGFRDTGRVGFMTMGLESRGAGAEARFGPGLEDADLGGTGVRETLLRVFMEFLVTILLGVGTILIFPPFFFSSGDFFQSNEYLAPLLVQIVSFSGSHTSLVGLYQIGTFLLSIEKYTLPHSGPSVWAGTARLALLFLLLCHDAAGDLENRGRLSVTELISCSFDTHLSPCTSHISTYITSKSRLTIVVKQTHQIRSILEGTPFTLPFSPSVRRSRRHLQSSPLTRAQQPLVLPDHLLSPLVNIRDYRGSYR
eukprot:sb/3464257/